MELTLAQRIKLRLDKLGKSERGASLEAGLSDSFLRNIRQNKSSSPRIDTLEKIAEVLGTSLGWLMTGMGEEEPSFSGKPILTEFSVLPAPSGSAMAEQHQKSYAFPHENAAVKTTEKPVFAAYKQTAARKAASLKRQQAYDGFHEGDEPYAPIFPSPYPSYDLFQKEENAADNAPNAIIGKKFALSERRLPVYGQAVGGIDGEFPINGSTLYSVLCPPQLSEISGAYAVSISGDSMYPRYEDGEIAFIDPTRRVKKGDYVIAQIMAGEGETPFAYVKKFIRHNAGGLILEQFNPAKELYFPHERVVSVHYIALAGTAPA